MALLAEHHAELDINAANEHDGLTPFWAAACMGHEPICRLLFAAGADPSGERPAGIPGLRYGINIECILILD